MHWLQAVASESLKLKGSGSTDMEKEDAPWLLIYFLFPGSGIDVSRDGAHVWRTDVQIKIYK